MRPKLCCAGLRLAREQAAPRLPLRQAEADERHQTRRREVELDQARRRKAEWEERCLVVDLEEKHVRQVLDAKLAEADCEIRRIEAQRDTSSRQVIFDDSSIEELVAICSDLPSLWAAETTRNSDRKEIMRTLISNVFVEHHDSECIRMRVVWADGEPASLVEVKRSPYCHRLIRQLAAEGRTPREIAERLTDMGLTTDKQRVWNAESVAAALRFYRRHLPKAES